MENRRPISCNRVLAALLFSSALAPAAEPVDLAEMLQRVAVEPPATVGFREERHNPMFSEAMILTGRLEYLEAGVLRKVIESPFDEDILVEDDHVVVTRDGKTRKLSLNRSRALRTTLGAIEALLAGNDTLLEESFALELTESAADWTLTMTPGAWWRAPRCHPTP